MIDKLNRRDFAKAAAVGAAGLAAMARRAPAARAPKQGKWTPWPFFAFGNGLGSVKTLEGKCKLLKDLGYSGLEIHLNHAQLPKLLEQLDKHSLKLWAVYTVPLLENPVDAKLGESIKLMTGRPTRIEMAIRSRKHKPSDPAGDAKGLEMVKRVSDLCGDTGPVVSVYPHTGFWTERLEDGVRLAKASGRKNVGANFNLVHWKWVKQTRPVAAALKESLPHLFSVTINGLKKSGRRDRIVSLDQGEYDMAAFLGIVKKVGFTGPVGLQCWSIREPSQVHLKRSIQKYRQIVKKLQEA